ncbi:hypothetical protein Droror1_Dr00011235 [Drosera rotundifolia]
MSPASAAAFSNPHRSIFDLHSDFFDSSRLIHLGPTQPEPSSSLSISEPAQSAPSNPNLDETAAKFEEGIEGGFVNRWSCNTCRLEFEGLVDQRGHFKSDFHRLNVKLSLAGKAILREENFDESLADSFSGDFDVSSISGSEDEDDKGSNSWNNVNGRPGSSSRHKFFVCLHTGEKVSVWKNFVLNDSEDISHDIDQLRLAEKDGPAGFIKETDLIEKLKSLVNEPRDGRNLRVVLLASGGHFAGCVFDGGKVVAHKTFHRYVVRAKAGKKQSLKDGSGKSAHSAGASLRRYNELGLKKDIRELLASWKPYFDVASTVFVYAPSNNRQLFFDGEKPLFSLKHRDIRSIPLTVRRPTFKEAKRLYNQLSQVVDEVDEKGSPHEVDLELKSTPAENANLNDNARIERKVAEESSSSVRESDDHSVCGESDDEVHKSTPLHEAAKSGGVEQVLQLLEQGLDPTVKDARGKTPYMLATDKEVRNTFRRFMALNMEQWDWAAAKVPSALTKEMEESQAAKQAEKDAKRKAKAKELKKLRKAKEKKAQAEAAQTQTQTLQTTVETQTTVPPVLRGETPSHSRLLSREEELKRKQAEEREKRAAAAERRIAAAAAASPQVNSTTSSSNIVNGEPEGSICSCCNGSLAGKIPFHRYNYKYCSTSCMHVHRQLLEDG